MEESGPRLKDLISYGIRFRKDSQDNCIRAKGCFSEYERAFLIENIRNIHDSFLSILRHSPIKIVSGYAVGQIEESK